MEVRPVAVPAAAVLEAGLGKEDREVAVLEVAGPAAEVMAGPEVVSAERAAVLADQGLVMAGWVDSVRVLEDRAALAQELAAAGPVESEDRAEVELELAGTAA